MPNLTIDLKKIEDNARFLISNCSAAGIGLVGVLKACPSSQEITETFTRAGFSALGWSRLGSIFPGTPEASGMLLRQPAQAEIPDAINLMDMMLISTEASIKLIESEARRQKISPKIILMMETGDGREGFMPDEILGAAKIVEHSSDMILHGIGTNFACLEGMTPNADNLKALVRMTEMVEEIIGRQVEVISGGNSSAWRLLESGILPSRVNQLRFGEAVLLGLETIGGDPISGCHQDAFVFSAEALEVRVKTVADRSRKQAVLAAGYTDFCSGHNLKPLQKGVSIIKASSDHLVVDINDSDVAEGEELSFIPGYRALVALMRSEEVEKAYVG